MIEKIKNLFSKKVLEAEADSTSAEQLATAALLIEVMVIDGNLDPDETQSSTPHTRPLRARPSTAPQRSRCTRGPRCCLGTAPPRTARTQTGCQETTTET